MILYDLKSLHGLLKGLKGANQKPVISFIGAGCSTDSIVAGELLDNQVSQRMVV